MFNPIKSFRDQGNDIKRTWHDLMNSVANLFRDFGDLKHLRTYSPETEAIIERISATEDGELVLNSGLLSPEEIEGLSRLQLANFLTSATRSVEMFGKDSFVELMPELRKEILKKMAKQAATGA